MSSIEKMGLEELEHDSKSFNISLKWDNTKPTTKFSVLELNVEAYFKS